MEARTAASLCCLLLLAAASAPRAAAQDTRCMGQCTPNCLPGWSPDRCRNECQILCSHPMDVVPFDQPFDAAAPSDSAGPVMEVMPSQLPAGVLPVPGRKLIKPAN